MLKNHPKGLIIAFFSNMGERFGFYTMMAILVYFLQAKFGLAEDKAGIIYSIFYFLIYGLALVGGLIADKTRNYKGTINVGIIVMFVGYILMSIPGMGLPFALFGLFTIAFGNGLFKGNLQAVVGQMYDDPKYSKLRDSAFTIFYMGINIGAFFAPHAARAIRSWYMKTQGFLYDAELPNLCHQMIDGTLDKLSYFDKIADQINYAMFKVNLIPQKLALFQDMSSKAVEGKIENLFAFSNEYIAATSRGFNYAFAIAAGAMLVSLAIYMLYKKKLPDVRKETVSVDKEKVPQMSKPVEKQRLIALGLVFLVVIFFWMAFHQNGLTLSYFARDYTVKAVDNISYLFFDIFAFLGVIAVVMGLVFIFRKKSSGNVRGIGALLTAGGGYLAWIRYNSFIGENPIEPETFQHFNPFFIVFLTPIILAFFGYLRKKGKEPSTPKKIGIGMILAAVAFIVLLIGSLALTSPSDLNGQPPEVKTSHYWLISTYFILTVAELFLSPMGISFVSKVAPPRFQGLAQGGWLGATALGNQLLFVGSTLWVKIELWQVWGVFILCCLASAAFIFSVLKKLEKAAASK